MNDILNHAPHVALAALAAELALLRQDLAELRERLAAPPAVAPPPAEQLVTLDQMAAIVNRRKRSLERYRDRLPPCRVHGRLGQVSLWDWAEARPVLEGLFGRVLPEVFPCFGRPQPR